LSEHKVHNFEHTVPAGTPLEHLAKPDYWANVSQLFVPCDRIHCHDAGGRFYLELYVRQVSKTNLVSGVKGGAVVAPLRLVRFDAVDETPKAGRVQDFDIKWLGPNEQWGIVRKDGVTVTKHLETQEIARGHLAAMATAPA
jgi:hypothetical protein